MSMALDYTLEASYRDNYGVICGVDEAGRGPLAGPVYAAAVILSPDTVIDGLNDSKKLSEKRRDALFDEITQRAAAYAVASASVAEIEEYNILNAAQLAMRRAVAMLRVTPDVAVIDGNVARDMPVNAVTLVGGDALLPCISAASILAKVSRDRLMREYDVKYPAYGFAKNKGYGSAAHIAAIRELGICEIHRPSFLTKILSK